MSYYDIFKNFAFFQKKGSPSLNDCGNHLGMPGLVEPDFLCSGDTQVQNAALRIGPAVIHAHNDALAVILAHHLELRAERQVLVSTGIVVLVKDFPARRLLPVESGAIIARLALDFEPDFRLFLGRILLFGGATRIRPPYSKSYMLLYVFSRISSSLLLTSAFLDS